MPESLKLQVIRETEAGNIPSHQQCVTGGINVAALNSGSCLLITIVINEGFLRRIYAFSLSICESSGSF